MITIQKLNECSDLLSITAILKRAFDEEREVNRIRGKIRRGSPEFSEEESRKIEQVLTQKGIQLV